MSLEQSLLDDHESSRKALQEKLDEIALGMRDANALALGLDKGTAFVEARVSSLIGSSYSPRAEGDIPYISRVLESICNDRARAVRECEVIQGHMAEVMKSLKIIKSIENDTFEKAQCHY